jgi:nitroreductase
MDFFDVIKRRYSYRGAFQDERIPERDVMRILDAGVRAPSGYNLQSASFVVVDEHSLIERIYKITGGETVKTASIIILVLSEEMESHGLTFEVEDYAAATENIMLAITALGYASVWMGGTLKTETIATAVAALLNIPEGKKLRAILPVGIPCESGEQREKKPYLARVHYNRF